MPRKRLHSSSIIAREKARARGLRQYFDSEPCGRGHVGFHFVSNGTCIKCQYDDNAKRSERLKKNRLSNRVIPGARVFIEGKEVKNVK